MKRELTTDFNSTNNSVSNNKNEKDQATKRRQFTAEMLDIVKILNRQTHKALILYLIPEHEHPKQDLIQLLSEMATQDYLCFVCCHSSDQNGFEGIVTLGQNLVLVHQGFSVIPIIKNLSGIVLTTQDIHPDWEEVLHHKFLWFHADQAFDLDLPNDTTSAFIKADLISYFQIHKKNEGKFSTDPRSLSLKLGQENQRNSILVEERLRSTPKGWQVYANLNLHGKIAVMTATFFDFEGEFFYSGGAERYLVDLAELCEELGRELIIFQYGNYPWMRRFKTMDVTSLGQTGVRAEGWILKCAKAFNQVFYDQVQEKTALNIYSAFFEAWPLAATPNIGISHGVAWDNPYCTFENAIDFWVMNERHIQGAKACEELVSVDTNTANWFQTVDFDLSQRTKVIPNYVDLSKFKPQDNYLGKKEKRVILYPRQLYSARGLYLVLEIMEDILETYPDVEFHFVGRGGEQDIALVLEKQTKWQERVKYYALSMDEMPQAYQAADISLIPTVHSEGTSLSCLEAMASGNALIATRVGGLSDLIINNYNGLLIDPQPEELKQALINLLDHEEKLILFKKRSLEVAQAFSKTLWRDRWKSLIKNKLDKATNKIPYDKLKKSRAVEIRLRDGLIDFNKLGELVTRLLIEGCLVYIRAKEVPERPLSFSRVQWLAPDTSLFSPCDLTIDW